MPKVTDAESLIYDPALGQQQEPPGISAVEQLLSAFEAHEGEEGVLIRRYQEIAEGSGNSVIRFLLQLIISDEEKHHAVTRAMASTLKGSLTWTRPQGALRGFKELGKGPKELPALTDDFIKLEREGIKEYKKLIRASKGYYRGLFSLLLRSMIHDSEKHLEILKFLKQALQKD